MDSLLAQGIGYCHVMPPGPVQTGFTEIFYGSFIGLSTNHELEYIDISYYILQSGGIKGGAASSQLAMPRKLTIAGYV